VHVDMEAFGRDDRWPADYDGEIPPGTGDPSIWPDAFFPRMPPITSPEWERPLSGHKPPHHTQTNGIKSMDQSSDEPALVTNANREKFVEDYVFWLTDKSVRPQLLAFKKGFFTCLDRRSLALFHHPSALQSLVEGSPTLSIDTLRSSTEYEDGYNASHPTIRAFWTVVSEFDEAGRRKLLEFVTACDRAPVVKTRLMTIVRAGVAREMLPGASTCFAKLMLPDYGGDVGVMRSRLEVALANSRGFGSA